MDFTKRIELEEYLLSHPMIKADLERVTEALLRCKNDKIERIEFLLELVIGHLEDVQRQIDAAKVEFGLEEGVENA